MRKPTLKEDVDRYGNLKVLMKAMSDEADVLNARIKLTLTNRARRQYAGDHYSVQVSVRSGADQVNMKKLVETFTRDRLIAEGILIEGKPVEYLTVTPNKPKL